jgi:hypothetical protein
MRHRKLLAALSVGALTVVGGMAAGPGNSDGKNPDHSESENGCQGINQARERVPDAASDTIEDVADLISQDQCGSNGGGNGNG